MRCRYFVRGASAWLELDAHSGAVRGWRRRARFVYVRGGRLRLAPTAAVLRGLRALAAGSPTNVRDGPPLQRRRFRAKKKPKRHDHRPCECHHHHCCADMHRCNNEVKNTVLTKHKETADVSVQVTVEDYENATLIGGKGLKRKRSESESSSEFVSRGNSAQKTSQKNREKYEMLARKAKQILLQDSSEEKLAPRADSNTRRQTTNRTKDNSSEVQKLDKQVLKKSFTKTGRSTKLMPLEKILISDDKGGSSDEKETLQNVRVVSQNGRESSLSSSTENKAPEKTTRKRHSKQTWSQSAGDKLEKRRKKERVQKTDSESEEQPELELTIEEDDVSLLRAYLDNDNFLNIDLASFDGDDDYKRYVFYKLNPLVNVERCPHMDLMLRWHRESSQDSVTLKDFATKLGLRCVVDSNLKSRENTRSLRSARSSAKYAEVQHSEEERPRKVLKDRDRNRQSVEASSEDSDSTFAKKKTVYNKKRQEAKIIYSKEKGESQNEALLHKNDRAKPPTESGGDRNLYSNLEDHAIVSWVSAGGREARVNGNKVWKELHERYPAITGRSRSWHSLRNRYLRYILPALGTLSLPPQLTRRLRAAAARGEIKSKKRPRQNSIFEVSSVQSASSRVRRPPRSPPTPPPPPPPRPPAARPPLELDREDAGHAVSMVSPERRERCERRVLRSSLKGGDAAGPRPAAAAAARSPTYAEVITAFAARQEQRREAREASPSGPRSARAERARTRRLYNPRADV